MKEKNDGASPREQGKKDSWIVLEDERVPVGYTIEFTEGKVITIKEVLNFPFIIIKLESGGVITFFDDGKVAVRGFSGDIRIKKDGAIVAELENVQQQGLGGQQVIKASGGSTISGVTQSRK